MGLIGLQKERMSKLEFKCSTLCFLFKHTSPLLNVFVWNTLHSIDLQFYVNPSRYCIRDTINGFFVNLRKKKSNKNRFLKNGK